MVYSKTVRVSEGRPLGMLRERYMYPLIVFLHILSGSSSSRSLYPMDNIRLGSTAIILATTQIIIRFSKFSVHLIFSTHPSLAFIVASS